MIRAQRPPRLAVWLAILALALNALVPIHLVLDLGETLATPHAPSGAMRHGLAWRLLALAAGHNPGDGNPGDGKPDGDGHRPACPVFGAIGALGGFALVATPSLPVPAVLPAPPPPPALAAAPAPAPVLAYRSRAPPFG